jgi:hypothetical protein
LVFPDAVVTSASSTKRRLYDAKRSLYRRERCVDSGANRATIVTARPTKAFSHGMMTTNADVINADILAFVKGEAVKAA